MCRGPPRSRAVAADCLARASPGDGGDLHSASRTGGGKFVSGSIALRVCASTASARIGPRYRETRSICLRSISMSSRRAGTMSGPSVLICQRPLGSRSIQPRRANASSFRRTVSRGISLSRKEKQNERGAQQDFDDSGNIGRLTASQERRLCRFGGQARLTSVALSDVRGAGERMLRSPRGEEPNFERDDSSGLSPEMPKPVSAPGLRRNFGMPAKGTPVSLATLLRPFRD